MRLTYWRRLLSIFKCILSLSRIFGTPTNVQFRPPLQPYWKQIFIILFTRLNSSKTETFGQRFSRFVYFLVYREKEGAGPDFTIKSMDEVQSGIFVQVFTSVILLDTLKLQKPLDRKLAIIGLTKLLLTSSLITTPPYQAVSPTAAKTLHKLIATPEVVPQGPSATDDLSHEADLDEMGFGVAFSTLNTTKKAVQDPAPGVPMAGLRDWVVANFKESSDRVQQWLPVEARGLLGQ